MALPIIWENDLKAKTQQKLSKNSTEVAAANTNNKDNTRKAIHMSCLYFAGQAKTVMKMDAIQLDEQLTQ